MSPARVRGLLLDAAGTLIHPHEPVGETYARVARAHGALISPWRIEEAFRRVFATEAPMLFPGVAVKRNARSKPPPPLDSGMIRPFVAAT